jgi:hypothetical protein
LKLETEKNWFSVSALSVVMHVALLGACAWYFSNPITAKIIAAGQGEGNGEAMMEVGTVDGKTLGFTPFKPVSTTGDEANTANNTEVVTETPKPDPNAEVFPSENPTPKPKDSSVTDRPTVQSPKLVSKDPLRGGTENTSIEVGRTGGSPVPSMTAGIGVGSGANLAGNTSGVPGGSAYGKIIQGILGRNYNPPTTYEVSGAQFVIVQLHIARDGRILSVVNGRVAPNHFKQRSANGLINNAVERAVIAANAQGLPPFPNGFLMGAQEAVAEVWFKYPK